MALYADTCILLPLFFRDASTDAALAWLEASGSETILISPWTRTEFASAAGIMARRGDISANLHREGLERFDRLVSARLAVEAVDTTDFDRARGWIADYHSGLRAGDALHLAVCMRLSATLCTADDTLARAADKVGVAVLNHNRPEAYLLSAAHYERLVTHLEDLEDAARVRERSEGPFIEVSLDDL